MNTDNSLEARVLIQEALLLAIAWKAKSSEPLGKLFAEHYAQQAKSLNAQQPPNTELIAEFSKAYQSLGDKLPRNT